MSRTKGTGSIRKRGTQYWIQYRHNGERYRMPGGPKRQDAIDLLQVEFGKIARGEHAGRATRITLARLSEAIQADYEKNSKRTF
jgi:hypothetical protein